MALDVEALFTGVPLIMRSGSTGSGSVRRRQRGGRDAAFAQGGDSAGVSTFGPREVLTSRSLGFNAASSEAANRGCVC
jgi:hypothetical protein